MDEVQSLRVEADECATLSPESERFRSAYRQVRPRSAEEVREILGLSPEAAKAVRESGPCCYGPQSPAMTPDADALDSDNPEIRAAARQATYAAFNAYVHGGAQASLAHLTPIFDRYLDISKAVLNIAAFGDIEVFDGATLTISASTQVLRAHKIIIHRTGRIVCNGSTTFKVLSLEGVRPFVRPTVSEVNKAQGLTQSRRRQ